LESVGISAANILATATKLRATNGNHDLTALISAFQHKRRYPSSRLQVIASYS